MSGSCGCKHGKGKKHVHKEPGDGYYKELVMKENVVSFVDVCQSHHIYNNHNKILNTT